MSKAAVVYWSGTGNTQAMAQAVADGAEQAGAQVKGRFRSTGTGLYYVDAALPRINRLNTGSLPGLQRLFQLGGRGKRSGNRPETAGGTEVIPVESDGRAVRIFKALGRLKSHAEGIGADHLVGEIAQVFIEVGVKVRAIQPFNQLDGDLVLAVHQGVLLILPGLGAGKEGIAAGIFHPQFHGREHLNVKKWLKVLQSGEKDTCLAFEKGTFGNKILSTFSS